MHLRKLELLVVLKQIQSIIKSLLITVNNGYDNDPFPRSSHMKIVQVIQYTKVL